MIIFTNDQSQHLLQNQDLIEIALSCLKNSSEMTLDALKNVTRLTSMIAEFSDVQDQMINQPEVIQGVVQLIIAQCSQDNHSGYQIEVMSQLIRITNTLCKNMGLIKNPSLAKIMLEAQMKLLQHQKLFSCEFKYKILETIHNLVQTSSKNCCYLNELNGYEILTKIIIHGFDAKESSSDSIEPSCPHTSFQVWNTCLQILSAGSHDHHIEPQAIDLCFERSACWHHELVKA